MRRLRKWNNRVFAGLLAAMVTAGSLQSAIYPVMPVYAAEQEPEEEKEIVTEEPENKEEAEKEDKQEEPSVAIAENEHVSVSSLTEEATLEMEQEETVEHDESEGKQTVSVNLGDLLPKSDENVESGWDIFSILGTSLVESAPQEVKKLSAGLVSGAEELGDKYVWKADSAGAGHDFIFRVNFSTSGDGEIAPGHLMITIPLHLLRDREGNFADTYEMSVPLKSIGEVTDATAADLVYEESEDGTSIIITNEKTLKAATNNYFEVTYATSKQTFFYLDYDPDEEEPGLDASDPYKVKVEILGSDGETLHSDSRETKRIYIDTTAEVLSTTKKNPQFYSSWNSSWGVEPDDADQYYYVVWDVETQINNATQKYDFQLTDQVMKPTDIENSVVGFIMSGSSNKNVYLPDGQSGTSFDSEKLQGLIRTGKRYDVVVTRHKASEFPTEPNIEYPITNSIVATVMPVDHVDKDSTKNGASTYVYKKPEFGSPTPSASLAKYGTENWNRYYPNRWDVASYELGELADNSIESISGLKYTIQMKSSPGSWTLEKGAQETDQEKYWKNPVQYELTDDTIYLLPKDSKFFTDSTNYESDKSAAESLKLAVDDYDFSYLSYSLIVSDATFNPIKQAFEEEKHEYSADDVVYWYIKTADSEDWLEAGSYDYGTPAADIKKDAQTYVSALSGSNITFKDGVKGVRATVKNGNYSTILTVSPTLKLYSTEHVQGLCKKDGVTQDEILVKNEADLVITDPSNENTVLQTSDYLAGDRIRKIERNSTLTKKHTNTQNDTRKKGVVISWQVDAFEKQTSGASGAEEYVLQDGGVFYDLLPKGTSLQHGTVSIVADRGEGAEAEVLDPSEYSITEKTNYKNSGRTLVIVDVVPASQYYTLKYNTLVSWDSLTDYGQDIVNPVAYETGNNDIAGGFADNGGNMKYNKDLFTELDSEEPTGAKKFIYSEEPLHVTAITAALAGLDKKTMSSGDDDWSYMTTVEQNGLYDYRLRYANSAGITTSNMVFYDSLENFQSSEGNSQWHGTLLSVDTSQLTNANPVIYISTRDAADLDFSKKETRDGVDNTALSNEDVWVKLGSSEDANNALASMAADPDSKRITAVAIDLGENGFTLKNDETATVILHMQAPDSDQISSGEDGSYLKAYNNIYLKDTVTATDGDQAAVDYFIYQNNTTVRYHVTGRFVVHKISSVNANTVIPGVTFRITGTSKYGKEVDLSVATNTKGNATFDNLEAGTYMLQEGQGVADYLEDHTEHSLEVATNGVITIDGTPVDSATYTVENKPRVHNDIVFYKRNLCNELDRPTGAKFMLSGTSDYSSPVKMVAETGANSRVAFLNVEKGTYKLVETQNPEGYVISLTEYTVQIGENGSVSITYEDVDDQGTRITRHASKDKAGNILIYNEPLVNLKIEKVDKDSKAESEGTIEYSIPLDGAKYILTGVSDRGTSVNVEQTTSGGGIAVFDQLEPGTYYLKETLAPSTGTGASKVKYQLDTQTYVVEVKQGKATIRNEGNWAYKEDNTFYMLDEKAVGERVVVTKKWITKEGEEPGFIEENLPSIHISTDNPLTQIDTGAKIVRKVWGAFKASMMPMQVMAAEVVHNHGDKPDDYQRNAREGQYAYSGNLRIYLFEDGCVYAVPVSGGNVSQSTIIDNSSKVSNFGNFEAFKKDGKRVYFKGSFEVQNAAGLFSGLPNVEEIDLSGLDFSKCKDLSYLFSIVPQEGADPTYSYLKSLKTIHHFDVLNKAVPETMEGMFAGCDSLDKVDLSDINMSQVTDAKGVFYGCDNLSNVKLPTSDDCIPRQLTDVSKMFQNCLKLSEVEGLETLDVSKVTTFAGMFWNALSFESLDLSRWDTSSGTNFYDMFGLTDEETYTAQNKLKSINMDNWSSESVNVSTGGTTERMFIRRKGLEQLYVGPQFTFSNDPKLPNASSNDTYSGSWTINTKYNRDVTLSASQVYTKHNENLTTYNKFLWQVKADAVSGQTFDSSSENVGIEPEKKEIGDGFWKQIDDKTWTYTFYVNNADADWYIWEDPIPTGYVADYTVSNPLIVNPSEKEAVITNTSDTIAEVGFGDLPLQKIVEVSSDSGVQEKDNTQIFTFDVTLIQQGDVTLSGIQAFKHTLSDGTSEREGTTIFNDGIAKVALKDNETIIFHNIPAGTNYSIKEETPPEFYSIQAGDEEKTGVITKKEEQETQTVIVHNIFNKPAPVATGSIAIKKIVTSDPKDQSYPFVINLFGLEPDTDYSYVVDDSENVVDFKSDESGTAVINQIDTDADGNLDASLALGDGQMITLLKIPAGAQFQITEKGGMYSTTYKVESVNSSSTFLSPTGSSAVENTDLSTSLESFDALGDVMVTFENTPVIRHLQTLTITKQVKGMADTQGTRFTMLVSVTRLKPDQPIKINGMTVRADGGGQIDASYGIEAGQDIVLSELTPKARYKITEAPNSMKASYVITATHDDGTTKDIGVIEDHNDESNKSLSTSNDTNTEEGERDDSWREIIEDQNDTITYTNEAPDKGILILKKTVTGNMGDRKRRFEFAIDLSETLRDAQDETKTYEHQVDGTFLAVRTKENVSSTFGDFKKHNKDKIEELKTEFGENAVEIVSFTAGRAYVEVGHEEYIVILGLPSGVHYTIQETDYSPEGYKLSEMIIHDQTTGAETTIIDPSKEQRVVSGIIQEVNDESDKALNYSEYTNTRSLSVATGVHTDRFPLVLPSIGLIGMLVSLLMLLKGRTLL